MRKLAVLALAVVPLVLVAGPAQASKDRCRVANGGTALKHTIDLRTGAVTDA